MTKRRVLERGWVISGHARVNAHPIEDVGAKLREMMPWIGKNKLVDKARN